GQRSVATIRVGIASRPTEAQPIVVRPDEVTVQPGERVEVRVLANDSDPMGGQLTLLETLEVPDGVEASVEGNRVVVRAPQQETTVQIAYTAQNAVGGRGSAVLTVTVREGATIAAPVARDVIVSPLETLEKTAVDVDVLAVAENPSGPLTDLAVSVPASHANVAQVLPSGRVQVTLGASAQTIPYLLTNTNPRAAGARAYAFITVPALGDFPPQLRPKARELRVETGKELVIDLDEFVQVGPGKSAHITDAQRVSATQSDGSGVVVDDKTLRYVSKEGYAGPASITFEVTDGANREDNTGRRNTLTLPITVYAADDYPPTFSPFLIEVPQGDPAVPVDLRALTRGPEGAEPGAQRYAYQLASSSPPGFSVSLRDSILEVSADPTAERGSTGAMRIKVFYGAAGELDAALDFRVVASKRSLARVNDVTISDGVSGEQRAVAVLAGAYNPYPDTPLTVVGAAVDTPGSGTASVSGAEVVVRPLESFRGQMVVRYWVRDATNDAAREVVGRIVVQVRDVPDAPGVPRATEIGDRTARLTWDPPSDNRGAPVTGYEVVRSPGGQVTSCPSTSCTLSDLSNDVEYTFTVRARNDVGWSAPSAASATVRPDAVPERPGAPTLTDGDSELTATWPVPASPGSPITQYTVEISPNPVSGPASVTTTTPTHTFRNLANGTAYTVRVKAHNRAEGDSGWSPSSTPETPAAVPGAPEVTAQRVDTPLGGQIDLTWTAAAENGAAIRTYEIRATGGGSTQVFTRGGEERSFPFYAAANGVDYTFTVMATNKAGVGPAGSAGAQTWGTPGKPTNGQASDTSGSGAAFGSGRVTLTWSPPGDLGGVALDHYEVNGRNVGREPRLELTGLIGGEPVRDQKVRACNDKGMCGEELSLPEAAAATIPQAPSVTATRTGINRFTYRVTAGHDGGASAGLEVCIKPQGGTPTCGVDLQGEGNGFGTTVVRAKASNRVGETVWVEVPVAVSEAPQTPRAYVEATGNDAFRFRWDELTGDQTGGASIDGYEYKITAGGGAGHDWAPVTGALTGWQDKSVPGGGPVVVEVRAVNEFGTSGVGRAEVTVQTHPSPTPSASVNAAVTGTTLSWSATDSRGIAQYRFRFRIDGGQWTGWSSVDGWQTSHVLSEELESGQTIGLEVQARAQGQYTAWGSSATAEATVP
ncbi:MAG: fibronectin type III domain-containing protein, partial [Cellulomonadaceae bacterium]